MKHQKPQSAPRLLPRLAITMALALLLIMPGVRAAEIDSMTARAVELDNAVNRINQIFNQRIAEGVNNANVQPRTDKWNGNWTEAPACDEDKLYSELRKAIFQSLTASWGLKGYALDLQMREQLAPYSYSLSLNDSIYRDLNYLQAFSLNLKQLSDVVNVDGHLIGLDKIGHFFAEGWQYFELTRDEDYELVQAIAWGKEQEQGKFGYATTGIYSFADLTANFNGWLFWNRVLLNDRDPLKSPLANLFDSPYIQCELQIGESIRQRKLVRAWSYNGAFDLSDYVDGAWDEGNNCNSYKDPVIEQKVEARIKRLPAGLSCPIDKSICSDARERYGDYAKYLLHPVCLTAG